LKDSKEKSVKSRVPSGLLSGLLVGVCAMNVAGAADVAANSAAVAPVLVLQGRTDLPGYSGDFDHFAVDLKGKRLFLAAEDHATLEVFDLTTVKHLKTIGGFEAPHSIFPIPEKHQLLVTDGSDSIKLLDDQSLAVVGSVKLEPGADSIGYDAASGHLYVVTGGKDVKLKESWLSEIDPVTGRHFGDVHFDADHVEALAVEQHGPRLYINVTDKNDLAVIDKAKRAIVARWPIHEAQQNALVQLDEATHRLFVVTRKPARCRTQRRHGRVGRELCSARARRRGGLRCGQSARLCRWRRRLYRRVPGEGRRRRR